VIGPIIEEDPLKLTKSIYLVLQIEEKKPFERSGFSVLIK